MRTRTEYYDGDTAPGSMTVYYNSDGSYQGTRNPPLTVYWPRPKKVKFVEYASDLSDRNTRKSWNSFAHYRRTNSYNSNRGYMRVGAAAFLASGYDVVDAIAPDQLSTMYMFGSQDNPTEGLPALFSLSGGDLIIADPPNLTTLINRSIKQLLPGIKPQLSLINSIIELKDFRKLPETIKRNREVYKRARAVLLQRDGRNIVKSWGRRTLRQILGGGADDYLQAEFNILPLLSDITGIRNALKNTRNQVENLLKNESKLLTRHWYADLGAPYVSLSDDYGLNALYSMNQPRFANENTGWAAIGNAQLLGRYLCRRSTAYEQARFHAEVQYSYFFSDYMRQNAMLRGLLDSFGVNFNPAIIWNAIPWSFVVDWVIGVSQWLDQFKTSNLEPVTVIHRYLYSLSVKRTTTIHTNLYDQVPSLAKYDVWNTTCYESAYKRVLKNISVQDIETSGFSPKEFLLSGALALSRRTK